MRASAVAEASLATAEAGSTMVKVARDLGWTRHPDPGREHLGRSGHRGVRDRTPRHGIGGQSAARGVDHARGSRRRRALRARRNRLRDAVRGPLATRRPRAAHEGLDAARHGDVRRAAPVPHLRAGARGAPTRRWCSRDGRRIARERRRPPARADDARAESARQTSTSRSIGRGRHARSWRRSRDPERAHRRGHLDRCGRVAGPRLGDRRREGRGPAPRVIDQTTTAALEIDPSWETSRPRRPSSMPIGPSRSCPPSSNGDREWKPSRSPPPPTPAAGISPSTFRGEATLA